MLKVVIINYLFIFNVQLFAEQEYFLTLRNDKVNLRQGPSFEYPIKIFYKKNTYLCLFKKNQIILEK